MEAEGRVVKNQEALEIGGVMIENATGTGIELRRLEDGTIEVARCCIRVPKPAA
jgi:hypothetical protein